MKKVLVPVDGSEAAERAVQLLSALILPGTAEFKILVVLSHSLYPYFDGYGAALEGEAERMAAVSAAVAAASDAAVKTLREQGHHVIVERRFGYPPDEISLEAEEWGPALIVMGRRGLRGPSRWLGSVSEHVLHKAEVPVVLVP